MQVRCIASGALAVILSLSTIAVGGACAQALPDPARAKALDKCSINIERAGAKLAVKKWKTLAKCAGGILKCVETKPGDTRCLDQARERCGEQLAVGAAEEAKLTDVVVRKCGSDLAAADLLDPAGLDVESLRDQCLQRFGIAVDDLAGIGACLTRLHACTLESLYAIAAPRAATLLAVAGVDPSLRAQRTCLTDFGGADEHVGDPKLEGRPVERCARAIENAAIKLIDASLKATGRCLDTVFTCVQVKNDPAASPACLAKADKRCDVEFANLAAAATRTEPALVKSCGTIDYATLASPAGLRLAALGAACENAGAAEPTTLSAYAACLTRTHRCGVADLARAKAPRADALLALLGHDLGSALCPSTSPSATPTTAGATPTPTPTPGPATATPTTTPPGATATDATETPTPVLTPSASATPAATATPQSACDDQWEPNQFPAAPASLNGLCGGGCTDDGYDLLVQGSIAFDGDNDFYTLAVTDLAQHDFSLQVRLSDIPDDTNYDLYLYRLNGNAFDLLDQSTNNGTGSETVSFDPSSGFGDASGTYGIEVRRVAGSSCELYTLDIEDPS